MSKSTRKPQKNKTSIDLNSAIGKKLIIHENITQEIIIVNIEKVKLILHDHSAKLKRSTDWINPLAIFLALLLADLTASFKNDFIGIEAPVWKALFILLTIGSGIYLIINIINICRKGSTIDDVIEQLKEHSHNPEENNEI